MADIRRRTGPKGTTYQVRYPSKACATGYAYKTFSTRKEAIAFREDSAARRSSAPLSAELRTVEQGVEKWLNICEKEGRNGRDPVTRYTLKHYEWRAAIINSYDWPKPLHELTPPDTVAFRSWLLERHSRDVSRKVLSSLHSVIRELITRGVPIQDFASGVTVSATSRYDEELAIPTEKDVQALLKAADTLANAENKQISRTWRRYRPMLYLAVDTGMRPQEYVVAAKTKLYDGGIKVDRALERGEYKISVTKTPAGRRFLELSPDTFDMVRHYAENHAEQNSYDLIFPTKSGHWQSTDNWRKRGFGAACLEAGLIVMEEDDGELVAKPKYTPYDLRHFYASMLIEQKTNLKRVQKLMGHQDIKTTLNT